MKKDSKQAEILLDCYIYKQEYMSRQRRWSSVQLPILLVLILKFKPRHWIQIVNFQILKLLSWMYGSVMSQTVDPAWVILVGAHCQNEMCLSLLLASVTAVGDWSTASLAWTATLEVWTVIVRGTDIRALTVKYPHASNMHWQTEDLTN